jgi:Zn-finger nucleic acid-binding protein
MTTEETVASLGTFLNNLDAEGEQKFELSHSFVIICPDCGQNIAFRGRCPKCGGDSWIPAGHTGGIVARARVLRWQKLMQDNESRSATNRRNPTHRGLRGVPKLAHR